MDDAQEALVIDLVWGAFEYPLQRFGGVEDAAFIVVEDDDVRCLVGNHPVHLLGMAACLFRRGLFGNVVTDAENGDHTTVRSAFDIAMGLDHFDGRIGILRTHPEGERRACLDRGVNRLVHAVEVFGRHLFAKPSRVGIWIRRIEPQKPIHARRPCHAIGNQVVAPIADLGRAFGRGELRAVALDRRTAVRRRIMVGVDRRHRLPSGELSCR